MIIVDDVHKRYRTSHGLSKWVLSGVTLSIPRSISVGLVGKNGAGKSTLLRLIGGIDRPTSGRIERNCRVSWPLGFSGGIPKSMTGRQGAKFVCRIHGGEDLIPDRLRFIQDFAELGDDFDVPIQNYSPGMRSRLTFAISLAFDFDVYLSDEVTAAGDAAFKKKANDAFAKMANRAGLIMVSHSESTLKEFCTAGIWLHEGRTQWFDHIDDALKAYKDSIDANDEQPQNATRQNKELAGAAKQADDTIRGWASNKVRDEVVSLDIIVNEKIVLTMEAREYRARLKTLGVSSTGNAAFEIGLSELGVNPGDMVRVVFAGTQQDLRGSPMRIN